MSEHEDLMKALDDADEQARVDALIEEIVNSPESKRERHRSAALRQYADPEKRKRHKDSVLKTSRDEAWRANVKEGIRKAMTDDLRRRKSVQTTNLAKNPEYRKKLSIAVKASYTDELLESRSRSSSKQVVCLEPCLLYRSGIAAAKFLGKKNGGTISSAISGLRGVTTAYGYHWRYATPEEVAYFWAERDRTGTDGPFRVSVVDA